MSRCPYTQKELKDPSEIVYMSCGHEYHYSLKIIIQKARYFKCGVYKCPGAKIISYDQAMNMKKQLDSEVELVKPVEIETINLLDDNQSIQELPKIKEESIEKKEEEEDEGIVIIPETEDDEDGNRIVGKKWKLGSLRVKRCRKCEYPLSYYHTYKWTLDNKLKRECDWDTINEGLLIEKYGFGPLINRLVMEPLEIYDEFSNKQF